MGFALLCQIIFVNLLQNPYVCSTTLRGVRDLGVSPNCEMCVRVTNAAPHGAISCAFGGHGRLRSRLPSGLAARLEESECFIEGVWIVREIRKHYVNVRFSDKEFEKLSTLMHLSGFNNRSKFIRYSILQRRDRRRYLSRNEANVAKQIELLRLDLKRIGVNYNQRVKTLNRLANVKDRQGKAIVNARDIEHDMQEMKRLMDGMVKTFSEIRAAVLESDGDEEGDEKKKDDADGP